jgi:hypothetical protein
MNTPGGAPAYGAVDPSPLVLTGSPRMRLPDQQLEGSVRIRTGSVNINIQSWKARSDFHCA